MASLYELAMNYRELVAALDDCYTDDEVQHVCELIAGAETDITAKGEAYVKIVRNLMGDLDALEIEIERLKGKKERTENAIARLKDNLKLAMNAANIDKIKSPIGTWSKRLGPWSVQIVDEDAVEDRFKIPQPPKVNKSAIRDEFIKTGEVLPGCEFQKREIVVLR